MAAQPLDQAWVREGGRWVRPGQAKKEKEKEDGYASFCEAFRKHARYNPERVVYLNWKKLQDWAAAYKPAEDMFSEVKSPG